MALKNNKKIKLTFLGGTEIVTGCNYLLEAEGLKILVDCGMVQGGLYCEQSNYSPFDYNPKDIDYLLVTHAHIDHIGRIPKLYRDGFQGKILCTQPTIDIAKLNLQDSVNIVEREAQDLGLETFMHREDVIDSLRLFEGINYFQKIKLNDKISVVFTPAGHILGSAVVSIKIKQKTIVFSGDLGNSPSPLIQPTHYIDKADYLIIESTYGDRNHIKKNERMQLLRDIIIKTINRRGVLMIPSFAVERTQELLFELNNLFLNKQIPKIPVFIDSPLAIKVTEVYKSYQHYFSERAKKDLLLDNELFNFPGLRLTLTREESKAINNVRGSKIIIAGSGMSVGGRILYHELRYLGNAKNTLLMVGFQVQGSLGRKLIDALPEVKIFRERVRVKAEVVSIRSYSAHADQRGLMKFIKSIKKAPRKIFMVQGEPSASNVIRAKVEKELKIPSVVPKYGDVAFL